MTSTPSAPQGGQRLRVSAKASLRFWLAAWLVACRSGTEPRDESGGVESHPTVMDPGKPQVGLVPEPRTLPAADATPDAVIANSLDMTGIEGGDETSRALLAAIRTGHRSQLLPLLEYTAVPWLHDPDLDWRAVVLRTWKTITIGPAASEAAKGRGTIRRYALSSPAHSAMTLEVTISPEGRVRAYSLSGEGYAQAVASLNANPPTLAVSDAYTVAGGAIASLEHPLPAGVEHDIAIRVGGFAVDDSESWRGGLSITLMAPGGRRSRTVAKVGGHATQPAVFGEPLVVYFLSEEQGDLTLRVTAHDQVTETSHTDDVVVSIGSPPAVLGWVGGVGLTAEGGVWAARVLNALAAAHRSELFDEALSEMRELHRGTELDRTGWVLRQERGLRLAPPKVTRRDDGARVVSFEVSGEASGLTALLRIELDKELVGWKLDGPMLDAGARALAATPGPLSALDSWVTDPTSTDLYDSTTLRRKEAFVVHWSWGGLAVRDGSARTSFSAWVEDSSGNVVRGPGGPTRRRQGHTDDSPAVLHDVLAVKGLSSGRYLAVAELTDLETGTTTRQGQEVIVR